MVILYDINKLRAGLKIMKDGEPCVVIHSEFVNPGKGQSFHRVKFRQLISGKMLEKTFKSGDSVELADIDELYLMYLYHDGTCCYFMDPKTFEQTSVSFVVIKDNIKWLIEELFYTVIIWNNNPIFLIPPNFVDLKVTDIQPFVKGDSISSSTKLATLSTGVVVKVPVFIKLGEHIKVDTRSSEYISRIK